MFHIYSKAIICIFTEALEQLKTNLTSWIDGIESTLPNMYRKFSSPILKLELKALGNELWDIVSSFIL